MSSKLSVINSLLIYHTFLTTTCDKLLSMKPYHTLSSNSRNRRAPIAPRVYAYLRNLGGSEGYGESKTKNPRAVGVAIPHTSLPEVFRAYVVNYLRRRGMMVSTEIKPGPKPELIVWLSADDVDYVEEYDQQERERERQRRQRLTFTPLWPPVDDDDDETKTVSRRGRVEISVSVVDIGSGDDDGDDNSDNDAEILIYRGHTLTKAIQAALDNLPQSKEIHMDVPEDYIGGVERFRRNIFIRLRRKSIRLDARVISESKIAIWLTRLEYLYRQERKREGDGELARY